MGVDGTHLGVVQLGCAGPRVQVRPDQGGEEIGRGGIRGLFGLRREAPPSPLQAVCSDNCREMGSGEERRKGPRKGLLSSSCAHQC